MTGNEGFSRQDAVKVSAVACTYFAAHFLSFLFPDSQQVLMAVWPPGGAGLAGLLLCPRRLWPAIIVAIFAAGNAANLIQHRPLINSLGFMTANVIESFSCAWLMTRVCGLFVTFDRLRDVLALLAGATFVNAASACIGAAVASRVSGVSFGHVWLTWFISDGLGILIVTPAIVVWRNSRELFVAGHGYRRAEWLAFLILCCVTTWVVFNRGNEHEVFIFPYSLIAFLIWPALRFGPRSVVMAIAFMAAILLSSSAVTTGPLIFGGTDLESRLLLADLYITFLAVTGMLLAASIAEQKKAEALLLLKTSELDRYFNLSLDLLCIADIDGFFRRLNPQWEKVLGYGIAELEGKKFLDFVHPDDIQLTLDAVSTLSDQKKVSEFENRYRRKDGSYCWLEWNSYLLGKTIYAIARDITERRKAREVLLQAKEDAEAATKAKSDFLNNIAHDFRTPLHAIMGFSEVLRSASLAEKEKKFADIIHQRSKTLLTLVEDLLDVSRLTSGKVQLRSEGFDLAECVRSVVEAQEAGLSGKGLVMACEIADDIPPVKGDVVRLGQILTNLVGNAVKYTDKGHITVRVEKVVEESLPGKCRIKFSVKDTGIGIARDAQQAIFEAFTRFNEFSGVKERGGVGLGLYITRTLVDMMGGTIGVVSQEGSGSEFIVTIDFDRAA